MAYVSVPKDLKKVKTKVIFNLTKRQLICFGIAIIIACAYWKLVGDALDTTIKVYSLIAIISPAVIAGIYEKDGLTLEKYLKYRYETEFKNPQLRIYKSTNLFDQIVTDTGGITNNGKSTGKKATKKIKSRKNKSKRK